MRNRDYTLPRHTNDSAIARARIDKGMTQGQLAEALGCTQANVAGWETGNRKPKMQSLMKIADVLGVDWITLIE